VKHAALVVVLAGCWGKAAIDISGTYRVGSHVASACSDDVPVAMPAAYLRLYSEQRRPDGYAMDACSSIDAATCSYAGRFNDPFDDGWSRSDEILIVVSDDYPAQCQLQKIEGTALIDEQTLTVEITTYTMAFDSSSPACIEHGESYYRDLPCTLHERLVATRLTIQP
jgi:hypothetical protein